METNTLLEALIKTKTGKHEDFESIIKNSSTTKLILLIDDLLQRQRAECAIHARVTEQLEYQGSLGNSDGLLYAPVTVIDRDSILDADIL